MKGRYSKIKMSEDHYRTEAREIMIKLHPELSKDFWRTHYVHHIDRNPFNNELSNLEIIDRRLHKIVHTWMKKNLL